MTSHNDPTSFFYKKSKRLPRLGWRWYAVIGGLCLIAILGILTRPAVVSSVPRAYAPAQLPAQNAQTALLDVSGEWTGYLYVQDFENVYHAFSLSLTQNGNEVTGTSLIQTDNVFNFGANGIESYQAINHSSATMLVRGTVDSVNNRLILEEIELVNHDSAPEVDFWCRKQGAFDVTDTLMTGVNIAAETCGVVNIVLERK
jgi:hypothetical protein